MKRSAADVSGDASTATSIVKAKGVKSKEADSSLEASLAVEMCRQALLQALGHDLTNE